MPRCFIRRALLAEMYAEANKRAPLETGGVLLGVCTNDDVWIESLIGPGPEAAHERTRFVPDHEYQEKTIAQAYATSGRRVAYVGDWHTHPNGPLALSPSDLGILKVIALHPPARQPRPVMVIAAGGDPWRIAAWRLRRHRWKLFGSYVAELAVVVM